jgi:hypothetical protein
LGIAALVLAALACQALSLPPAVTNRVVGSGKDASEARQVDGEFTAVQLDGSADVNILLTNVQSVNVESDDNIVPLVETKVVGSTLIVNTKPGVNFTTTRGIIVTVGIKSLERVSLNGSGNMRVAKMSGPELSIHLNGSGDVFAEGTVDDVTINLMGSGNVTCDELKAHTAEVNLLGSGNISLFADQSLNANLPGSGNIRYKGDPPQVTKNIMGSGHITP